MPTYEYVCRECGEHVEVVQSFRDDPLTTCGICAGSLRKVFSAAGIIFKGSGYYVTDTREQEQKAKESSTGDGAAKEPAASSSDGAASSKPSSDTEAKSA